MGFLSKIFKIHPQPKPQVSSEPNPQPEPEPHSDPATEAPLQIESGVWILNPAIPYKMTLRGLEQETAQEIRNLLDEGCGPDADKRSVAGEIWSLLIEAQPAWVELEEYVLKFKALHNAALEKHKGWFEPRWEHASPEEREGLLEELSDRAWGDLTPRIEEVDDFDIDLAPPVAPEILQKYGLGVLLFYTNSYSYMLNKVVAVKSRDPWKDTIERAAALGLVTYYGQNTREYIGFLAEKLRLKDINAEIGDAQPKPFTRKAAVVEFLFDHPEIVKKLVVIGDVEGFYKTNRLPEELAGLSGNALGVWHGKTLGIAHLMLDTYVAARSVAKSLAWAEEGGITKFIITGDSECRMCASYRKRKYTRDELPVLPMHLGCSCDYYPIPDALDAEASRLLGE